MLVVFSILRMLLHHRIPTLGCASNIQKGHQSGGMVAQTHPPTLGKEHRGREGENDRAPRLSRRVTRGVVPLSTDDSSTTSSKKKKKKGRLLSQDPHTRLTGWALRFQYTERSPYRVAWQPKSTHPPTFGK